MIGRGQGGFTLVEMMIVLAVLAMGAVLLGPMLHRGTSPRDLDALGQRVSLAARSARNEAMRHNVASELAYDGPSRAFLVLPGRMRVTMPADVAAQLETGRELEEEGRHTIRFLPDGRSSGGEIRLTAPAASLHLSIDWMTGWVKRVPS